MATYEGHSHQTDRIHICTFLSIGKPSIHRVLVVSRKKGDDRTDVAHCRLLPDLESLLQVFTVNGYVIVHHEEHTCLAFRWYFIPPVQGVEGSPQKVDWSLPSGFIERDWCFVRLDFIIPDDVELSN
jgi:hypothetical protein